MSTSNHTLEDSDEKSMKQVRYDHPTGWLYLMMNSSEGLHLMIDTLLTAPDREFTKAELADAAGISRHTVRAHVGKLLELGIVQEVSDGKRYRFNLESPVAQEICELNSAINAVGVDHIEVDSETGKVGSEDEQ